MKTRRALFVFLIPFFMMCLVSGYSVVKASQVEHMYEVEKRRFLDDRDSAFHVLEGRDFLARKIPEFHMLKSKGVIGFSDNIVWAETLESIRETMALQEFQYTIASPAKGDIEGWDDLAIEERVIDLNISFPHDESLFQFFTELDRVVDVIYEVSYLDIVRSEITDTDVSSSGFGQTNLTMSARLSWVILLPRALDQHQPPLDS